MLVWPTTMIPHAIRATPEAVLFTYQRPDDTFAEVAVSANEHNPRSRLRLRGVANDLPDEVLAERLHRSLAHHLRASEPQASTWVAKATRLARSIADTELPRPETLRRAVTRIDAEPEGKHDAHRDDGDEPMPADLLSAVFLGALSRNDFATALAVGDEFRSLAGSSAVHPLVHAIYAAIRGLAEEAIGHAESFAAATVVSSDHRLAALLLSALDQRSASCRHSMITASREGRVEDYIALMDAARSARDAEAMLLAAEQLFSSPWPKRPPASEIIEGLLDLGLFTEAERRLRSAVELPTPDPEAVCLLSELSLWKGEVSEARQLAVRANLGTDDQGARLHTILGVCAWTRGDAGEAREAWETALDLDDLFGSARLWRAQALLRERNFKAALQDAQAKTLSAHPIGDILAALANMGLNRDWQRKPVKPSLSGLMELPDAANFVPVLRVLFPGGEWQETLYAGGDPTAVLTDALARFGLNRSRLTTVTSSTGIERVHVVTPRIETATLQLDLAVAPFETVYAELERRRTELGCMYADTYGAELLLWKGEYEQASTRFESVWQRTHTRWGYVGAGAAQSLLGDYERALEYWREGLELYGAYLDTEATYAYRGDVHYAMGRLDLAAADLEQATRATPTRLGAWVSLTLVKLDQERPKDAIAAFSEVRRLHPTLVWEACREAGLSPTLDVPMSDLRAVVEKGRELLRGNRSSKVYTFSTSDGRFHAVRANYARRWSGLASQALGLSLDVLAGCIARSN